MDPDVMTVTGVDLNALPLSVEQIKIAVSELAQQIRLEEMPTADSHHVFADPELLQKFATIAGGMIQTPGAGIQ